MRESAYIRDTRSGKKAAVRLAGAFGLFALVSLVPASARAQQGSPATGAPSGEVDVRDILARADSVYDALSSLEAEFDQTIDVTLLGRTTHGSGTWYQKGRGRFKMDFGPPKADDVIVADGSHLWLYYPSTHPDQVIRSTIDANVTGAGMVDLQGRIFDEAAEGYDAELEGREEIDGRETLRILLTPTGDSPYRHVRVWVDADSYLVRKFEIREENETLRTVVLRDLKPNHAISDATFSFTPPAGADVFEG